MQLLLSTVIRRQTNVDPHSTGVDRLVLSKEKKYSKFLQEVESLQPLNY